MQEDFEVISFIPTISREKESTVTLSGTIVVHKKYERKNINVIISANELYLSAKKDFLDAFLSANTKKYSTDNIAYIDVEVMEEEDISYIGGKKQMPRYNFTLTHKYKS